MIIDVGALSKSGSEMALVSGLAAQTGYWPVFSFLNSINSTIDLASVGLIGQKGASCFINLRPERPSHPNSRPKPLPPRATQTDPRRRRARTVERQRRPARAARAAREAGRARRAPARGRRAARGADPRGRVA